MNRRNLLTAALTMCAGRALAQVDRLGVHTYRGQDLLQPPADLPAGGVPYQTARTAPTVDFIQFADLPVLGPRSLWSSWGDGCFASDGKYYTSIGNHLGVDGEARVYQYDPARRTLRQVVSVQEVLGHRPGTFGLGKIHTRIEEMPDGWLYFGTYWGTEPKEEHFTAGLRGGGLLRYQLKAGKVENLGVLAERNSLPASASDPARGRVFLYAVNSHDLIVYDTRGQKILFRGGGDIQNGERAAIVDRDGYAYFSTRDGRLARWDARANEIRPTKAELPRPKNSTAVPALRACTRPMKEGTVIGVSHPGGELFSFDPATERVTPLGPTFGSGQYTTVLELSPDERFVYYAPGAHGQACEIGAPVVRYEIATGTRSVLAFLGEPLRKQHDYLLGGCYNLKLDPKGTRLFLTCNGGDVPKDRKPSARDPWNRPSILVFHISPAEL